MSSDRALSPRNRGGSGDRIESSADERTPIVSKKRVSIADAPGDDTPADPPAAGPSGVQAEGTPQQRKTRRNRGRSTDEAKDKPGWWKNLLDKYGAMELDNKGSVARDHLALERTFLAWLRTSLAFASIGIAITQLFRLNTTLSEREDMPSRPVEDDGTSRLRQVGKPLGATFLGIAIVMLFIGWRRYFESQYWLSKGKFPASRGSIFLVTIVAGALIVASLVVVLSVSKQSGEPS